MTDKELGDERFFFPKQMLGTPEDQQEVFQPYYQEFSEHIKNDRAHLMQWPVVYTRPHRMTKTS